VIRLLCALCLMAAMLVVWWGAQTHIPAVAVCKAGCSVRIVPADLREIPLRGGDR